MQLTLTRSGGFLGAPLPPVKVDTKSLSADEARELEGLVGRSNFFDLPTALKAEASMPDRFQYDLEVVGDDGRRHAVIVDETAASDALRELIQKVQAVGKKKR
jgi:hypothetical protein